MQRRNIIVVGAGPVGTVAALACARFGLSVTLLEAQSRIDDSPRASTTQPPTLEMLAELGLIDEYLRVGLISRTFQFWDRPTRRMVAEFDFARLVDETAYPFVVQTEQHKLANMAIARLRSRKPREYGCTCFTAILPPRSRRRVRPCWNPFPSLTRVIPFS